MSTSESQRPTLRRGVLIAIEGIDGSGKSTQARLLVDYLTRRGYESVYLFEPTDGKYGCQLRQQAKSGRVTPEEEFRLFLLDRKEDVENNIRPALEQNKIVVIDRYFYSSMAYQGARGIDPELIRTENEKIAPRADLVIYLRVPLEKSSERILKKRNTSLDQFEGFEYQKKVASIYEEMNRRLPEFRAVDASGDIQTVHKEITRIVEELLHCFKSGSQE
ncbi:dTMP kinase [Candidatus Sumerlaeota bacterium]|nr:dTMP kinase [Candidatus Sumerlaeota bacterium]